MTDFAGSVTRGVIDWRKGDEMNNTDLAEKLAASNGLTKADRKPAPMWSDGFAPFRSVSNREVFVWPSLEIATADRQLQTRLRMAGQWHRTLPTGGARFLHLIAAPV